MNRHERLSRITELVIKRGTIHIEDIVAELNVSGATARRDLDVLAKQQLVTRTRGGAVANSATGELPLRYHATKHEQQKRMIAEKAVSLIRPGQVVALNGGTTTTELALTLGISTTEDHRFDGLSVTVVTNAVNIAADLSVRPNIRVVVTGGVARAYSYELVGPLATTIIPDISIDTAFLGINGIVAHEGVYNNHEGEAVINAALAQAAREVIIVTDHTKLGVHAFAKIIDTAEISTLITDSEASDQQLAPFYEAGINVITA